MTEKVLLTPEELSAMLGSTDVVVIDTRNPDAYAAGHIPGAVNIHDIFTYLATSTPEGMAELRSKFADAFGSAGLSGAETAVIYEGSMASGFGQSCRGYFLLKFLGYPKAMVLHGGFQAWQTAGLPVSTEAPSVTPKEFPLSDEGLSMMLDREAVLKVLGDESIALLDVRDVDEWLGTSSSPYGPGFLPAQGPHSGCGVAGMVSPDEADRGRPDVQVEADEVLAECHSVGITPETPVYLYCFKGGAGVELAGGAEGGGHQGRPHVFRVLERMEPRSQPALSSPSPPWAPASA